MIRVGYRITTDCRSDAYITRALKKSIQSLSGSMIE